MMSEKFIDKSFEILCSTPEEYRNSRELFSSLYSVVDHHMKENKYNEKTSIELKNELELLYFLSKYRAIKYTNFNITDFIDKISVGGKFTNSIDFLKTKIKNLTIEEIDRFFKEVVVSQKKLCDLLKNKKEIKKLIDDIEYGNYDDYDELIKKWEMEIEKSHNSILTIKKIDSLKDAISLDLMNDDYEPAIERFRKSIDENTVIQTGFPLLDNALPHGGLEKRRIYIFGGETGVGKSIILQNILTNTIKYNKQYINQIKPTAHLFITAENLIDESLIRFYCSLTDTPHTEVINKLKTDNTFSLKNEIVKNLRKSNTNVIFYYVQARIATLADIENLIETTREKYELSSIFIDYLDLIRSGTDSELRHELGEVTLGFKRFAVTYDIPVVTVTQLNRSGYNDASTTITSMGESMQKAHDSDFIAFMQNTKQDVIKYTDSNGSLIEGSKIKFTILKNRNGPTRKSSSLFLLKTVNGNDQFCYKFSEMPQISESDLITSEYDEDCI